MSGSDPLALYRVGEVGRRLKAASIPCDVHHVVAEGSGDLPAGLPEFLPHVLDGRADALVCAATEIRLGVPRGLSLVAVLREHDPRYRCVSRGRASVCGVPPGSTVVVADPYARAQIRNRLPELGVDLVEDLDRLADGLREGVWAAGCLPPDLVAAGPLWGLAQEPISITEVMPAVGQGSIALLTLPGHECAAGRLLDEPAARACLDAETSFLRHVIEVPETVATAAAGAFGGRIEITGLVAEAGGAWLVLDEASSPIEFAEVVGREVAESCKEMAWARRVERSILARSGAP